MKALKASETVTKQVDLGKQKCVESVFAPVVESGCIDRSKVKGFDLIDSGSRRDVNMKSIFLFVELNGGMTNKRDHESIHDVGQHEFKVNVGDLVWAVIKKQKQSSWWPAVVCDGSNAPKEASDLPIREDDCLVRCFGNGSYIWCSASEVKPFVGYFDRLSSQSTAKKFLDAFNEVVAELGHRVKTEFTCSCFCKAKMEKAHNLGDLSVGRFEPAKFVDYIKDLARVISVPDKIDYVVKQSCLSAFYCSLGHLELPMDQLTLTSGSPSKVKTEEENGYFNDDVEKSEKPFETRGRRKSKFLSYPRRCRIEESVVDVKEAVELNETNWKSQPVKKPGKKWSRKNIGVQANVCSSEVLSQLQSAGQDCVFPCESKYFNVVEWFVSGFRKQAFNESSNQIPVEMLNHQNVQKTIPKKVKRKKDKSFISPTHGDYWSIPSLITDFQNVVSINLEAQSKAKNRTEVPSNQNIFLNFGNPPLAQQRPCKLEPKKQTKNAENVASMPNWSANISTFPFVIGHGLYPAPISHFTNEFGSNQPCFTENHSKPQVGLGAAGLGHVPKKRGRKKKNINLQANPGSTMNPFTVNHGEPQVGLVLAGLGHMPKPFTGNHGELQVGPVPARSGHVPKPFTGNHGEPQMGLVPVGLGRVPKKRGRKRKNIDLQANPGSIINSNLNGNGIKMKNERRLKIKEVGVPCIDLSYYKVLQDNVEEVKGTAFLLKFSPDHPLPSNQDLNSVFSKYGALIESETQVLTENLSGQVVFLDSSSAGGAFWGLQNDKPFGPVLVNYKIQHLSGAESMVQFKTPVKSSSGFKQVMPNSNKNSTEVQIVKRSKTVEEIRLPSMDNLSYSKVNQGNKDVTSTALLLKFSPNHPLPSFQEINSVFCKYGELNEFETQVSGQNFTGQVVFVNPSAVADTIQRLEKDQPFGQALLSYQVHHSNSVQSAIRAKSPVYIPLELQPCQDLVGIKKNLEMMNLMLEKAGDGLSLEMRRKLESGIKGLMTKVSAAS